jgi:RHS repeat-associated protein
MLAIQNGAVNWVHQDPVTKSQRITNSSGAVISTIDLDPWGGETNRSANGAFQPHKYTTYERDGNGGDDAMMRRYQSNWNRFSQPDPYDGSYDATNPQSFNRYSYVENDPVNAVDPTGLAGELDQGIGQARDALRSGLCRSLFGNNDPLQLLNNYLNNGLITVGSSFPVLRGSTIQPERFSSGNTGAATSYAAGSYPSTSGVRVSANPITINRNGFYFSGRTDRGVPVNTIRGGGFEGLNLAQIRGVVILHELLHVVSRIPSDLDNLARSQANSELVRLTCFSSLNNPNAPISTPTTLPNTSITPRPIGGGGGGGDRIIPIFYGGGGFGGFDSFRWLDLWLASMREGGGYGEVVGYHLNTPHQ